LSTRQISRSSDSTPGRRDILRLGLGAVAATWISGCVDFGNGVQIAVVWSDRELERFREVIQRYEAESGRSVEVIGATDNLDAFIRGRLRAGHPPDVAVFPQPGLVVDYAREGLIDAIPDEVSARFDPFWTDLVTVDGRVYGAWLKAAHKSLLWYRKPTPAPATWDDLATQVEQMAGDDGPAPLAIGAADGWVLTDWLENVLIARAPELYDELARGGACWGAPEVDRAFRDLAEVWRVPDAFPGGGERALLTQFEESVIQVMATGEAALLVLGDFALPVADDFRPAGTEDQQGVAGFPFPAGEGSVLTGPAADRPVLVGGDVAVVLKGSRAGHELVDWLTDGPDPFRSWMQAGGYLSPNATVCRSPGGDPCEDSYPPESLYIANNFHHSVGQLHFDLSDQLPGAFAAPGGSWRILQEFFADVTASSPDFDQAVERAIRRLQDAAGRGQCAT